MKKFYLFTLVLVATVTSAFAQFTDSPKVRDTFDPNGKLWYKVVFRNGGYPDNVKYLSDNFGSGFKALNKADGDSPEQLFQLVGADLNSFQLVSKSGNYLNLGVDSFSGNFSLNSAKQAAQGKHYNLKLIPAKASDLQTYEGVSTKIISFVDVAKFIIPYYTDLDYYGWCDPVDDNDGVVVVFEQVGEEEESGPKMFTLTSSATGYEAGKTKFVFEGATDGKVEEGQKVTLKITNESDNLAYFKSIKVNGEELLEGNLYEYTFEKELTITADTNVEVVFFQPEELVIVYPNGGEADVEIKNAKFIEESTYYAPVGEEVEVKATPKEGYKLISIEPSAKFTVTKKTFVKIRLESLIKEYPILIPNVEHGTITLGEVKSGDKVAEGTEITIEVKAEAGYELETLTVGGVDVKDAKKFTVGENNTIVATFKKTTAVESLDGVSYQVYPNPATDVVEVQGLASAARVQLLDLTGKVVLSTQADFDGRVALQVAQLPKGLYLLRSGKVVVKLQVK